MAEPKRRYLIAGGAAVFVACSGAAVVARQHQTPAPHPSSTATACANLPPVYHPQRLQVLQPCISFEGVVLADLHEQDGDRHLWIKPDLGYQPYLNAANVYAGTPALVAEIVPACTKQPANEAAAAQCPPSPIQPPEVGAHVEVVGRYVVDMVHGWAEIHPVASIKIL